MRSRLACLLLWAMLWPLAATAEDPPASAEYALKAAFLYNFAVFTEWPTPPPEAFDFCILGKDPFGAALDGVARKSVQGKAIRVRRLHGVGEAKACHLLFVPRSEHASLPRVAALARQQATLTVTEANDEDTSLTMIRLLPEGGRIGFDVNQTQAKAAGLAFSSKLLRLARSVY